MCWPIYSASLPCLMTGRPSNRHLVTGLATAAGAALGTWLVSEKLHADHLKGIVALVLIAVAISTACGWSARTACVARKRCHAQINC
jgi:uncharacterized membrane protein YfcA